MTFNLSLSHVVYYFVLHRQENLVQIVSRLVNCKSQYIIEMNK